VDFVVVGLGLGAIGVLLGLALRDLAPRAWPVRSARELGRAEVARRVAWARPLRAAGRVLALAGLLLWVVTLAALAGGANDRAGAILVMAALTLLIAAALAWGALYARRYHPRPARRGPRRPVGDPLPLALAIEARATPLADPPAPPAPAAAAPAPATDPPATRIDDQDEPPAAAAAPPAEPHAVPAAEAAERRNGTADPADPVVAVLYPVGRAS